MSILLPSGLYLAESCHEADWDDDWEDIPSPPSPLPDIIDRLLKERIIVRFMGRPRGGVGDTVSETLTVAVWDYVDVQLFKPLPFLNHFYGQRGEPLPITITTGRFPGAPSGRQHPLRADEEVEAPHGGESTQA